MPAEPWLSEPGGIALGGVPGPAFVTQGRFPRVHEAHLDTDEFGKGVPFNLYSRADD